MRPIPFLVALGLLLAVIAQTGDLCPAKTAEESGLKKVRRPAVAGMFYPGDRERLKRTVADSLGAAKKEAFSEPIKAIMAPHAGYYYCRRSLAAAYKQIAGPSFTYDTVVLIGPSHGFPTKAAALSSAETWATPLGPVPVDTELSRRFVETSDRIEFDDRAHAREHSLEVQLPYLVVASGGKRFKIVPMVTSSSDRLDQEIVARALARLAGDPKTLIVISTDLSHYPSAEVAQKVDKATLKAVESLSGQTVVERNRQLMRAGYPGLSTTMCGMDAVLCVEWAVKWLGITRAKTVSYTNSGMVEQGNDERVVGYGAVVFTGPGKGASRPVMKPLEISLSDKSRKELISMARSAAKAAVEGNWVSYEPSRNPELQVKAGCFVTFKNKGKLRGCIGQFTSDAPLWRTVREVAVSSATRDTRFMANPIKPSEIPHLEVEVSVLSPLSRVVDPLKEVVLGQHGIIIRDKGRSGTFLPQVATETGWSLKEFLGHCARDKAGLGWDGWKSKTANVYTYTATIIHEKE